MFNKEELIRRLRDIVIETGATTPNVATAIFPLASFTQSPQAYPETPPPPGTRAPASTPVAADMPILVLPPAINRIVGEELDPDAGRIKPSPFRLNW